MLLKNKRKQFLGLIAFSLLLTACDGNSDSGRAEYKYLAVQIGHGDNWSIMDGNGKIVVKEEYAPKDQISFIASEGVYWVKSNDDNKFHLYSIESPKKPISKGEYTYVTNFTNGKAFVSDGENPIQIIDTKGNIKETLPREIRLVHMPIQNHTDRIAYIDKAERWGLLNLDGDIIIKAQYSKIHPFSDGVALVEKEGEGNKLYIIGSNGKEKGTINLDKYKVIDYKFKEGKLPVCDLNKDNRLVYLNTKGEVTLEISSKIRADWEASFLDGYAVISCEDAGGTEVFDEEGGIAFVGKYGVIDKKGETVIRVGKYDRIYNIGNGQFFVGNSKGKYSVVDSEDNAITDDYDGALLLPFDGNFVMWEGSNYILVKADGKEIKNSEFKRQSDHWYRNVVYFDLNQIATDLVAQITPKGYTPIVGKQQLKDIVNTLNLKAENQKRGKRFIELEAFKADVYDVKASLDFNESTVIEKTHKEVVNDGWFAHEKTVSDGWVWNEEAMLQSVFLKITGLDKAIDTEKLKEEIGMVLKDKGFKFVADGPYYEAKNGDKYAGVSINAGFGENYVEITFYPYKEYSEDQFE